MKPAEVKYESNRVNILCGAADLDEWRPIGDREKSMFGDWIASYRRALHAGAAAETLLTIGRRIYGWLDGDEGWMARLLEEASPPFLLEFRIPKRADRDALAFLEVPWELLADDAGHLAADPYFIYCPVRRIGKRGEPGKPSDYRLSSVFMAAAPRGDGAPLRYEEEESAILDAAGNIGMDLTVEESGAPGFLGECMAREKPVDVLHISCHGTSSPGPLLMLENKEGGKAPTGPGALSRALGGNIPRLLFVSACMTSEPDAFLNSFSSEMIRRGTPSVLGWGGSVRDAEASRFASGLYRGLALSESLEEAVARSRFDLSTPAGDGEPDAVSRDWHLARLYVGARGGGVFTSGGMARRPGRGGIGHKEFLDARDKRIPVAGPREFVGRRRQIQKIMREFRAFENAGVLIHGFGRQGKSSLAARIANRTPWLQVVVVFEHYDAMAVLDALVRFSGTTEVKDLVENKYKELIRDSPENLEAALRELLEGPFRRRDKNESGDVVRRPILLVMDDFERALDEPAGNDAPHRVKTGLSAAIRSVIQAFSRAGTDSRLLFTSRYRFTLPYKGRDLADDLLPLPLPPMDENEGKKQAAARERYVSEKKKKTGDPRRTERCIRMARGNPGLQDLLFTMSIQAPDRCDKALEEMESYIESGGAAGEESLRSFLENLAVDGLIALLTPTEKDLLKASTLFRIPAPLETLRLLDLNAGDRLFALGLWDAYEDLVNPDATAAAVNPLARPKSGELSEEERRALAKMVLNDLFERWGGEGGNSRPFTADLELTRLALLTNGAEVLAASAAFAVAGLESRFLYRPAAEMAVKSIEALEASNVPVPTWLYLRANEVCFHVGDMENARLYVERAVKSLRTGKSDNRGGSDFDLGATLLQHGRLLVQSGEPTEALDAFNEARTLFKSGGFLKEQAVVAGDIARIRVDRGEVEEALELQQEVLKVYEELGDRRSRAVTLGDIARIRVSREVEEALELHQERLQVFEELEDRRSRAVTLGDIARIRVDRGEVEEALELHRERLRVFEELGDRRERAVTLGDIARIRVDRGEVEEALELHQERLRVFEELGDRRERAVTLGDIARIRVSRGEVEEALSLFREKLKVCEELGDRRERAVTLGDIARIRVGRGEVEEALELQNESLEVYKELGNLDGKANTLWSIAQINLRQKSFQEAFENLSESYAINLKLGRLDGICFVGLDLGKLMCQAGQKEQGLEILGRSKEGFVKLGREGDALKVEEMMKKWE